MVLGVSISMMVLPSRFRKKFSIREKDHGKYGYPISRIILYTSMIAMVITSSWFHEAMDPTNNFIFYFLLFIIGWLTIVVAEPIAVGIKFVLRIG